MKPFILWDHDGVLVETEPWYFEATRSNLLGLGISLQLEDYLKDMALGRSAWERARAIGVSDERIDAAKAARNVDYQRHLLQENIEIDGVTEVLSELGERHQMAIVTTAKREDFALIHRNRNMVQHMSFVLTSGDYPRSKPAPDPYLAALDRFKATPDQAIVVEDSERGLRAAVAAGIDCVVVANDFVRGQDFSAATWWIDSLEELPSLIAGL